MKIRFKLSDKQITKLAKARTITFKAKGVEYEITIEAGVSIIPVPDEILDQIIAAIASHNQPVN